MAVLDVLNLNLGTEQNPNWVAHDLHDKRISTTAVTTATHLLATNAGVTAMNPITAANLASVLGAISFKGNVTRDSSLNDYTQSGFWYDVIAASDSPVAQGHRTMLVVYKSKTNSSAVRLSQQVYDLDTQEIYMRTASESTWGDWSRVTYPTAMRDYQTLTDLASALGVGVKSIKQNKDWNTIIEKGVYFAVQGSNAPESVPNGLLSVEVTGVWNAQAYRVRQIYTRFDGSRSHYRIFGVSKSDGTVSEDSGWKLIYDQNLLSNSTELSSLASALGVNKLRTFSLDGKKGIEIVRCPSVWARYGAILGVMRDNVVCAVIAVSVTKTNTGSRTVVATHFGLLDSMVNIYIDNDSVYLYSNSITGTYTRVFMISELQDTTPQTLDVSGMTQVTIS